MTIAQAIAKRVNSLLKDSTFTQYRLAKEMAISHNTMTNIVNAKNKSTNLSTIFLLCRAFEITIDEFFDDPIFKSEKLDID